MTTSSIEVRSSWLEHLKNYKIHGKDIRWYENGQKRCEIEYKDGNLHGKSINWYHNGQKRWEYEYKDGNPHGKSINWYDNGQKCVEDEYQNGVLKNMITYEKSSE